MTRLRPPLLLTSRSREKCRKTERWIYSSQWNVRKTTHSSRLLRINLSVLIVPGLNGYWREWLDEPIHFGFGAEAEEVMNPDWAASALSSPLATAPDGGGRSCGTSVFVHHHPDYDDMFTQIFRRAIPLRYRIAI